MTFTNSSKAHERLRQREQMAQRQWENDLREAMQHPAVRRVFTKIIYDHCGLKRVTLGNDALRKAEADGIRWVASWLDEQLQEHSAQQYLIMFEEALRARREDTLHLKEAAETAKREADE